MIRPEVHRLVSLGQFPREDQITSDDEVSRYADALLAIPEPVTDEEAAALATLFGDDSFYGLAETLIHVIETSPTWPEEAGVARDQNRWVRMLRERAERARSRGTTG